MRRRYPWWNSQHWQTPSADRPRLGQEQGEARWMPQVRRRGDRTVRLGSQPVSSAPRSGGERRGSQGGISLRPRCRVSSPPEMEAWRLITAGSAWWPWAGSASSASTRSSSSGRRSASSWTRAWASPLRRCPASTPWCPTSSTSPERRRARCAAIVLTTGTRTTSARSPSRCEAAPDTPVYGSRLTLGFVRRRLRERGVEADLRLLTPGQPVEAGAFRVTPSAWPTA